MKGNPLLKYLVIPFLLLVIFVGIKSLGSAPADEVEKIFRYRELTPAQKGLMLSARKESGKYTEGVVLSKSMEVLFRAVPPSLYLALAMTEPEEKKQRYDLMQSMGVDELGAALEVAADLDRKRGIEPLNITFPTPRALENLA